MARETTTVTIDGNDYKITQLGAKQGRKVLVHALRILGAGAAGDDGAAVAAITRAFTDEEVDFLCDTFSKATRVVNGDKEVGLDMVFDDHFVGRYHTMAKWLWANLTHNYESFLGDLGGLQAQIAKAMGLPKTTGAGSSDSSTLGTGA